ncbi:hypothetical protein QOT17_007071 [Balamuthia mandrillaris]
MSSMSSVAASSGSKEGSARSLRDSTTRKRTALSLQVSSENPNIWRYTALADAVTRLHNRETRETKDNSSLVSQFINYIIKEHQTQVVATLKETEKRQLNDDEDSQADASSTSAMVTKKSRLELTPVVAAANPMNAHLVNLQATMQKLVEEIKGIKQTQVSITCNCTWCG